MNGPTHRLVAGAAIGIAWGHREQKAGRSTSWPIAGGALGAVLTAMPDYLEPALHPNHRQFFHSMTFALALVYGFKRLYDWQPQSRNGELGRKLGMVAISAYLIHLALDATTAKSLPLLGK